MLFKDAQLDGIRSGAITRSFRFWKQPRVRGGGGYRCDVPEDTRSRPAHSPLSDEATKELQKRLKALGLTLSFEVGYRMSPLGACFRSRIGTR